MLWCHKYASRSIGRIIRSLIRWLFNVARVGGRRNRDIWWGNIKKGGHLDYLSIDWRIILKWAERKWDGGLEWIALAQDRNRHRAFVNAEMNVGFHKMSGISWLAENLSGFVKGICLMDLVS